MVDFESNLKQCQSFIAKLRHKNLILDFEHVGSSAVLNNYSDSKDIDFICRVESFAKFESDLKLPEFAKLKSSLTKEIDSEYGDKLPLNSYRLITNEFELNIIIVESVTFYLAYIAATMIQKDYQLNIVNKAERINFHQTFVKYYYNSHKTESELNYFPEITDARLPKPIEHDVLDNLL